MDEAARKLHDSARSARYAGDFMLLERLARELLAMAEETGSAEVRAEGWHHLSVALLSLSRTAEAIAATTEAIRLSENLGDRLGAARGRMNLGLIEIDNNNDVTRARRLYDESLPAIRELAPAALVATMLANVSELCRFEGDYRGALRNAREALEIFRDIGEAASAAWALADIAHYHLLLRQPVEAVAHMNAAFEYLEREPNPRWVAWYFDVWFLIAASLGRLDVGARLLAFTDKYRDERNQPRSQAMLPWFSSPRERLVAELGVERIDQLVEEGEALTFESAQRLAVTLRESIA